MTVSVRVEGASEVRVTLNSLSAALDVEAVLDEATASILNRIRARFHAETAADGVKWAPLRPKTIIKRIQKGFGPRPILYMTGHLFQSIQLSASTSTSREISTDVAYAPYLQEGTDIMAARPFLEVNQDDADLVGLIIAKRIKDAIT